MAASLFVNIRDKNDKGLPVQVTCELRDMKELDDPLDRELQYWTSRMYTKFKTENHGLWATAISNIKEYEDNL